MTPDTNDTYDTTFSPRVFLRAYFSESFAGQREKQYLCIVISESQFARAKSKEVKKGVEAEVNSLRSWK